MHKRIYFSRMAARAMAGRNGPVHKPKALEVGGPDPHAILLAKKSMNERGKTKASDGWGE